MNGAGRWRKAVVGGACLLVRVHAARAAPPAAATPTYVGGQICVACHEREAKLWRGSHHDLAMQPANQHTVLGNFNNATFTKDGVTSTFTRRNGQYFVRTDGPDGKLHKYRIAYVFGIDPLQQYLVDFGRGRYQVLGIAWDTRPATGGGQRWFHLYPQETIDYRDELHWTGAAQNWNFMCADCHSTNLRKNYRANEDRFDTTWSDINVSCEACHGPGSQHVQWARSARAGAGTPNPSRGLTVQLGDTSGGSWMLAPGAFIAHRTQPRSSDVELDTCGRCHARRAQIWEPYQPGEPMAQAYLVALLDAPLYHADGQIKDEVYEYGSFLQSKMHAAGVTCSDCHDPHSLRLRAAGNALCARCHLPAQFDVPQHHFHKPGTPAAQCVSCHMIERTYMVVDGRRDHSFRVPRPDLSEKLGAPNACNDCHTDKSPGWAAAAIAKQRALAAPRPYAEALYAGRTQRADAEAQLLRTAQDPTAPAIARATALSLLARNLTPQSLPALQQSLQDPDPLVRRAAVDAVANADAPSRVALVFPLLDDPIRTVRLAALGALLDVPRAQLTAAQQERIDRTITEYRQVQAYNADRAEAHGNLGMLEARLGNTQAAQSNFDTAIRLQPSFISAYVHLADLYRSLGKEEEAERVLRKAVSVDPNSAAAREALGLCLVRQKRVPDALPELAKAAELQPDVPSYAYVYAVALHDSGQPQQAVAVLTAAHERAPAARDVVIALIQYEAQAGNQAAAIGWARTLVDLSPQDGNARRLLATLETQPH